MLKTISKVVLLVGSTAIISLTQQVMAAERSGLNKSLHQCAKFVVDSQRLACFDRLIAPFETNTVKRSTETVVATKTVKMAAKTLKKSPAVNSQAIDDFAKEHLDKTLEQEAEEINSITLTISNIKKLLRGNLQITFQNGQQWQQKDSTRMRLKQGEEVVLVKGALGTFYLKKMATHKRIRVKRLK